MAQVSPRQYCFRLPFSEVIRAMDLQVVQAAVGAESALPARMGAICDHLGRTFFTCCHPFLPSQVVAPKR